MKVVESLLNLKAPIYTVHDNFITTPPHVKILPEIYTQVIINMGFPLKIINAFIKINLSDPYYTYITLKIKGHKDKEPIPLEHLQNLLNSLLPDNAITKERIRTDQVIFSEPYI